VLLCLGFGKLISVSCRCTALPGEGKEGGVGGERRDEGKWHCFAESSRSVFVSLGFCLKLFLHQALAIGSLNTYHG
jgi:hypothetical protein